MLLTAVGITKKQRQGKKIKERNAGCFCRFRQQRLDCAGGFCTQFLRAFICPCPPLQPAKEASLRHLQTLLQQHPYPLYQLGQNRLCGPAFIASETRLKVSCLSSSEGQSDITHAQLHPALLKVRLWNLFEVYLEFGPCPSFHAVNETERASFSTLTTSH